MILRLPKSPFTGLIFITILLASQAFSSQETLSLILQGAHEKDVEGVAFSRSGKWLVSADNGGKVVLWDLATRKPVKTFTGKNFTEAEFSADDSLLAAAGFDNTVRIWSVATGKELFSLKHEKEVEALAFSPVGNLLASAGGDRKIKIWNSRTGRETKVLAGHQDSIYGLAFSADGKRLFSASRDRTIRVWDVKTGKEIQILRGHEDSVYSVASGKSGKLLISGCRDGSVKIWDVSTGREIRTMTGHEDSVHGVALSRDEKLIASASFDDTIKIWETSSGKLIKTLKEHGGDVNSVAFSPDNRWLASVSDDKTVRLWEVEKFSENIESPAGSWTGGFWLGGNWVAIDVSLRQEKENLSGTANIIFPSYSNSLGASGVNLASLKTSASEIEFEIHFNNEKIVLSGQVQDKTISGKFEYGAAKGDFGLARVVYFSPETLEKYYGIYKIAPDRFVSILRSWSDPRTLNYVDYKTGQLGTLWASSENEFFSGAGRGVSFPIALRASFDQDASGKVRSLLWQTPEQNLTARKIEVKEERITFKNGNVTLGGTLILPASKGRHPVVIVTPGDFGTNRNQLRLWAHNYVSKGIAALIFDSRGAGESTGAVNSSSFSDLANDVLAIVQPLKTRDDVNPQKIGLFGFSNSAWTASLAASRSKDVAFLILQSFSGVPPWKQESFRAETQLRVDNFPESVVKQGADFMRLKFETARTGKGWEQLQEIIGKSRGERWLAYTNMSRSLERLRQNYETSMTYDPVPALENLKIPVLAYWGGKDTYVPATESIVIFKQAMAKAGNKNYVVKIYPGGRHDLVEGESGSPSIGARLKKFPAGFWKMKYDWVFRQANISK